jgi:hypothetical protein
MEGNRDFRLGLHIASCSSLSEYHFLCLLFSSSIQCPCAEIFSMFINLDKILQPNFSLSQASSVPWMPLFSTQ